MATQENKTGANTRQLNDQATALAEELGRIAGTIEGTAEAWMNEANLAEQLTRVRDRATKLLNSLTNGAARGRDAAQRGSGQTSPATGTPASNGRRAQNRGSDPAHAPGKRHRKPAPTMHGAKKSDERIPKMRTAQAVRQRRKSYA